MFDKIVRPFIDISDGLVYVVRTPSRALALKRKRETLRAGILEGIEQAREGKTTKVDFSQYLDDDNED